MIRIRDGHHISVPLTKKAMFDFENDVSLEHIDDMYEDAFDEEESTYLYNYIYLPLGTKLNLMIDIAEEEKIPLEKIEPSIQFVNEIICKTKNEKKKSAYNRFLKALQKAKECGTCVWVEM